jgi:hypothetical protein
MQPAVGVEHLARRLLVAVVAGEDGLAANQDLAVRRRLDLEAGEDRADRAELDPAGTVDRARGRALREAVALQDRDVEREEELRDLGRERCASGDRDP